MYLLYSRKLINLLLSSSLLFIEVNYFYGLQFLLMPGLVIQMILLKITQECTSLLWLRNQNIKWCKIICKPLKITISYISMRTWMMDILIPKPQSTFLCGKSVKIYLLAFIWTCWKLFIFLLVFVEINVFMLGLLIQMILFKVSQESVILPQMKFYDI